MGDIGLLVRQGWNWLRSEKKVVMAARVVGGCCARERFVFFMDQHWPVLYMWGMEMGRLMLALANQWRNCVVRGVRSLLGLEYTTLFVLVWSGLLSLSSTSYLFVVLSVLGASAATIYYLDYTPGLFIVGLYGIIIMWLYGNIWVTAMLFIVGGYMFFLNRARPLIYMSTAYSVYCAYVRVGWLGVFLSLNLAFLSNDLLNKFLQGYDRVAQATQSTDYKDSEPMAEELPEDCDFSTPTSEAESFFSTKSCKVPSTSNSVNISKDCSFSKIVKTDASSIDEMKRIINSANHYEALGVPQYEYASQVVLKREYRRKAMLVHPDKNMGIPLADESFKKLQSAYEVLSDLSKKKDYDEQLRREETETQNVNRNSYDTSQQSGTAYWSEESRRIVCRKCGNSHLWICTTRSKASARWCEDCQKYHPAKDGDGWVEYESSTATSTSQKVEIPRAFVCAESKIFDVSEWAVCQFQGTSCRPNTHRPSFHVNMVGLDKTAQRTCSSKFHWDLDAEMVSSEDEDEFELWFQQALAAGLFSETSKRRKSWSPFKINHKIGLKSWRRSS